MSRNAPPRSWKATRRSAFYAVLGVVGILIRYAVSRGDRSATYDASLGVALVVPFAATLLVGVAIDVLRLAPQSRLACAAIAYFFAFPLALVVYFLFTPHELDAGQLFSFVFLFTIVGAVAGAVYWSPPATG